MQTPLLPERRDQLDFFVCDILDATPKGDLGSMEHPMFSLSKNPDTTIRHYEHNGNTVTITPSVLGLATIFDKDILIYCTSQLVAAKNAGREVSRTVRVTAYDLLKATNRPTGGESYQRLEKAFERLSGTRIKTNITTGSSRIKDMFGILERVRVIEKSEVDSRMVAVEITLSEWLYNAIMALEVLTLDQNYFRLRKPIERRLYELARKHCGNQGKWKVGLATLRKKSGYQSPLKKFRFMVREIIDHQHLPGYRVMYREDTDTVTFYSRQEHGHTAMVGDIIGANKSGQGKRLKWA